MSWYHDIRWAWKGDIIRVVIADDVVALPLEGWSCAGFGTGISLEWLLTQPNPKIPGVKTRRVALAYFVARALARVHGWEAGFLDRVARGAEGHNVKFNFDLRDAPERGSTARIGTAIEGDPSFVYPEGE